MTGDKPVPAGEAPRADAAAARRTVRSAMKAAMATLDASSGAPYASLVGVATTPACLPIIAISSLSHHHGCIAADPRVSLLFDGTPDRGDALAGARVTVSGRAEATECESVRARYMARHPDAFYTSFGDFEFYRIEVDRVHLVAGFGKVGWFDRDAFVVTAPLAGDIDETAFLAEMNEELGAAIGAIGNRLGAATDLPPGRPWRLAAIDAEGVDLIADGAMHRADFPETVAGPEAARTALRQLMAQESSD